MSSQHLTNPPTIRCAVICNANSYTRGGGGGGGGGDDDRCHTDSTLSTSSLYDVQPSRMSSDDTDDEKGNDIERRWWAASFSLETRVYTALLGRFSHSFVRDAIFSILSLSLPLSLGRYSFSVSRNLCISDGSPLLSCFCLPSLFYLLSSTFLSTFPSLSSSIELPRPSAITLFVLCLPLFLLVYLSQDIRASRRWLPDSFLADEDGAAARAIHFPLFPLLSLSLTLRSPPTQFTTFACLVSSHSHARAYTHIDIRASRARESVHVAVDRFSVILSPFRSRNSFLRSHARRIRNTDFSLSTLDTRSCVSSDKDETVPWRRDRRTHTRDTVTHEKAREPQRVYSTQSTTLGTPAGCSMQLSSRGDSWTLVT